MVVFLDPDNVGLDTKIMILSGLVAEILVDIGFYIMAIIKIQDGGHNVSGGSGSYQKWKTRGIISMWKKNGAFVRYGHIQLLRCSTKGISEDYSIACLSTACEG